MPGVTGAVAGTADPEPIGREWGGYIDVEKELWEFEDTVEEFQSIIDEEGLESGIIVKLTDTIKTKIIHKDNIEVERIEQFLIRSVISNPRVAYRLSAINKADG